MELNLFFLEFERKYENLKVINSNWYKNELNIISYEGEKSCIDKEGNHTEEWYRARMLYAMVRSGKYPSDCLGVELSFPKGNGGKSINPDITIFKDSSWKKAYEERRIDDVRKLMLGVFEAKKQAKTVESAIVKQIEPALERRIVNKESEATSIGIYFDNHEGVVIVTKQGLSELQRRNIKKMIISSKNIVSLNVANRDKLDEIPSYAELIKEISNQTQCQWKYDELEPLSPQVFATCINKVKRAADKYVYSDVKTLLAEICKLCVYSEQQIEGTNLTSDFFIRDTEFDQNSFLPKEVFVRRMHELYEGARDQFNINTQRIAIDDCIAYYADEVVAKMTIEIVKIFQGKSILQGITDNFNQIIFQNFGSPTEKQAAGQFLTPIPIIEPIAKIINQRNNETAIDPSAGLCDFLAVMNRHALSSKGIKIQERNYYAMDISSDVTRLAELNLVINGLGHINFETGNSIFQKFCRDGSITEMSDFTPDNYDIQTWKSKKSSNKDIKQYKIGVTNPPFGKGRDLRTGKDGEWDYGLNEDIMSMYETWMMLGKPLSIDLGIIFLENIYKSVEPGGRFAIVVSNSIASIASWKEIRLWLLEKIRLVAIYDLPQNTFGETGVATTIIVAYKPKSNEKFLLEENYEVFAYDVKHTGYEVQTVKKSIVFEPEKKYDPETFEEVGINEDFTDMLNKFEEYMTYQNSIIRHAFGRI